MTIQKPWKPGDWLASLHVAMTAFRRARIVLGVGWGGRFDCGSAAPHECPRVRSQDET